MSVRWRLKETLEEAGLTVYALGEKMGGATRRPALYAITATDPMRRPRRVSFELLEDVIEALSSLTGREYKLCDLLEYVA